AECRNTHHQSRRAWAREDLTHQTTRSRRCDARKKLRLHKPDSLSGSRNHQTPKMSVYLPLVTPREPRKRGSHHLRHPNTNQMYNRDSGCSQAYVMLTSSLLNLLNDFSLDSTRHQAAVPPVPRISMFCLTLDCGVRQYSESGARRPAVSVP